jgi:hypothetical protein
VIAYRVDLLPKVDVPWWDGEMGMGDWRYPLNSMYIYIYILDGEISIKNWDLSCHHHHHLI